MNHLLAITSELEAVLPVERTRLVRLCATITGNTDIAVNLAQETLLEAWRHIHELRDPQRRTQWLSGIARNVCLRWASRIEWIGLLPSLFVLGLCYLLTTTSLLVNLVLKEMARH